MKMSFSIAALILGGLLSMGCMNTASFSAKDGGYQVAGRSTTPEYMAATLSMNRAREINAETYRSAVGSGMMYPYGMVGPVGDYRFNYCPNGICMAPIALPVTPVPTMSAPSTVPPPDATPAQKPVSRQELDETQKRADEARVRADAALSVLAALRANKGEAADPSAKQP